MKPQPYLEATALKYFNMIEAILKIRGMDDEAFSVELSMLSNEYAKYEASVQETQEKGYYVKAKTGWEQVGPWVNVSEKAISSILKLSPKFGLNPADFEKIKASVKEPEKPESKLKKMTG